MSTSERIPAWRPQTINYRTLSDLEQAIRRRLASIPAGIDLVVGIPRSGLIPAGLIATYLNVPAIDLEGFLSGRAGSAGSRPLEDKQGPIERILIVDDSVHSGAQLDQVKQATKHISGDYEFIYLAVFGTPSAKEKADVVCEIVETPRIFSWNVVNSWIVTKSCVDIDGLLCPDPAPDQNDDGIAYEKFLLTTNKLYSCRFKIAHLVTARLEKYRAQTEDWLHANGIQYDQLHMVNLPTAKERTQKGKHFHANHKAEIYASLHETCLFIESASWQAKIIAESSGKPACCTETGDCYFPSQQSVRRQQIRHYTKYPRAAFGLLRNRLKTRPTCSRAFN